MIECIKHLHTHLQDFAFADRKLLGERSIEVADTVAPQVGKVARRVAGYIVARLPETVLIKDRVSCLGGLVITQASRKLGADHIRSLVAIHQLPRRVIDGQRLSGLESHDAIERPAAYDGVQHRVHCAANQAVLADGEIENNSVGQAVRRVVGANCVLCLKVVEQLRVVEAQISQPGIPPGGGIIGEF